MFDHDLLEQCEGFTLHAIEDGNCIYRGMTFDDEIVLLTIVKPVDKSFTYLSLDDVYNVFNTDGYESKSIQYAII